MTALASLRWGTRSGVPDRIGEGGSPAPRRDRGTPLDASIVRRFMDGYGGGQHPFELVLAPVLVVLESSVFGGRANLYNPTGLRRAAGLLRSAGRRRHVALFLVAAVFHIGWFLTVQNTRLLLSTAAHLDRSSGRVASDHKVLAYLEILSIVVDPTCQLEISAAELNGDGDRLLEACHRRGITHLFGNVDRVLSLRAHLRPIYRNQSSRLGGVRLFRDPPTEETAVFEIVYGHNQNVVDQAGEGSALHLRSTFMQIGDRP